MFDISRMAALCAAGLLALSAPARAAEGLACTHDFDRPGEDALNAMLSLNAEHTQAQRRRITDAGMTVLMARLRACMEQYGWSETATGYAANYRIWRLMRQRLHPTLSYFTAERRRVEQSWTEAELEPMLSFVRAYNDATGSENLNFPSDAQLRQMMPIAVVVAALRRAGLGQHAGAADRVRLELYASLMAEDFAQRFAAAE